MRRLQLSFALFTACVAVCGCRRQLSTVFPQNFGPESDRPTSVEIYYSPETNLERIDCGLIDQARQTIDMDAYSLTDYAVAAALRRRAAHGVRIRIYLDRQQTLQEMGHHNNVLDPLARTPSIELRVKESHVLMHLKSYVIDGKVLRTGSANFSPSGLKQQDNDIIIIRSTEDVQRFERNFEAIWTRPGNDSLHP